MEQLYARRREDTGLALVRGERARRDGERISPRPAREVTRLDDGDGATAMEMLVAGEPFVTHHPAFVASWRAAREIVTADGTVDIDKLEELFGQAVVRVEEVSARADDDEAVDAQGAYGERPTRSMQVSEYASWWRDRGKGALLYLKDWHLTAEFPDFNAYTPPAIFSPDWLNEWYDHKRAGSDDVTARDYRFAYIGPAGSWTSMHTDVLRSSSWSTNVCGVKRWTLVPPDATWALTSSTGRGIAPLLRTGCGESVDSAQFCALDIARAASVVVIQQPGETIYVPPGWHHSVENLTDCLSINHNWIHPSGAIDSVRLLLAETEAAAAHIEDVRLMVSASEFDALVDRNVAMNAGMGCAEFRDLLSRAEELAKHAAENAGNDGDDGFVHELHARWAREARELLLSS